MHSSHFKAIISSEAELREMLGTPSDVAIRKAQPALDQHARAFIAQSPFLLIGTSNDQGNLDVSPRGDLPGFALPLDERTLVIPDRPVTVALIRCATFWPTRRSDYCFSFLELMKRCGSMAAR